MKVFGYSFERKRDLIKIYTHQDGSENLYVNKPDKVRETPGVYIIILDRPICRLLATDRNGILYVGETSDIHKRLEQLQFSLPFNGEAKKNSQHSIGSSISKIKASQRYEFLYNLKFTWMKTSSHKDLEQKILEEYRSKFGEVPPFNAH